MHFITPVKPLQTTFERLPSEAQAALPSMDSLLLIEYSGQ